MRCVPHDGQKVRVPFSDDLNLVGSRRPLERLTAGLDAGGGDLEVAEAYRLTDRSQTTWRQPGQSFTPGRLDFQLYSGAFLTVDRAFPFSVGDLTATLAEQLGVQSGDAEGTSDHLPVIVDYRWREQ